MAKQMVDDEDSLRRRARRRLIGAVALTTAVVVIVPMVLDSEPKPVQQNIELRIPDKDKAPEFAPKIDTPYTSAVIAASTPPAASVPALVAASAPAPVKPATAALAKPAVLAAAPVSSAKLASPEKSAAAGHATEAAQPAVAEHDKPAPASGFVVQIGAFSSAEKAHAWQKNLSGQGFKAYTEKVGDKTRVRVGPFPTREAANKARHKLEARGLHVNVVDFGA
jgi:DedD protein